jgi:hypothetical protein
MKSALIILFLFLGYSTSWAQKNKWHFPSFDIIRTGPYIGIQKGNYFNVEFGFERQWKDLKFFGSNTSALYGGMNYNLRNGIIGGDIGGWKKLGFLGITYGGSILFRTDFVSSKAGFTPAIGIKISKFHFQMGYQFLFPLENELKTNEFYLSLRYKIWSQKKIRKD